MQDQEPGAKGAVKSADRVIDLFELMARWGDHMTHSELASTLDIPKSSLTQLLRNLTARGYVEYVPETKKYKLGTRLVEIARAATGPQDLISFSEATLNALTKKTGESSALNFRFGDETEVMATVFGHHRLITHMRLGDRAPLHLTSAGKVFLSNMPDEEVTAYVERTGLIPATKSSISSVHELKHQLRRVREERLAYVFEEFNLGLNGMAVPIFDRTQNLVAALNVVVPTVRFNDESERVCVDALRAEAAALERKMNGAQPVPVVE